MVHSNIIHHLNPEKTSFGYSNAALFPGLDTMKKPCVGKIYALKTHYSQILITGQVRLSKMEFWPKPDFDIRILLC
jgi:hypothetical protein